MAQKLWEKNVQVNAEIDRFTVGRDREMDMYLAKYDVLGSMAHITMLESIGLLTSDELKILLEELKNIYASVERGEFVIEDGIEDVHSQVELMLTRRLGDVGKKIHSGRSRNDQVLVDLKLFIRAQLKSVAEELNLPFVYVRSSPKDHGLENLIEGELRPGMKVVVVEDLISTGGSSLKAVEAIRRDGCEVIGMIASFTYGFDVSVEAFKKAKVELVTLTNYNAVLEVALKTDYINEEDIPVLQAWREDPSHWTGK